jgi:DNA-binding protein YbaB
MEDALRREVDSVAQDLRMRSHRVDAALAAARTATYDAESPDGMVSVTVDGRPRVTAVRISPYAIRDLGAVALTPLLTQLLAQALESAASGTRTLLVSEVGAEVPGLDAVTGSRGGER